MEFEINDIIFLTSLIITILLPKKLILLFYILIYILIKINSINKYSIIEKFNKKNTMSNIKPIVQTVIPSTNQMHSSIKEVYSLLTPDCQGEEDASINYNQHDELAKFNEKVNRNIYQRNNRYNPLTGKFV